MKLMQIVSDVRPFLPLPSEWDSDVFTMPCSDCREVYNNGVATVVRYTYLVTFRKEYVGGVAVGWQLDTTT